MKGTYENLETQIPVNQGCIIMAVFVAESFFERNMYLPAPDVSLHTDAPDLGLTGSRNSETFCTGSNGLWSGQVFLFGYVGPSVETVTSGSEYASIG